MKVVIVESPTKAKALRGFLGRGFRVLASMGHVRDLPPKTLGVDVERDFRPTYHLRKGARKVIKRLREGLSEATVVLLASQMAETLDPLEVSRVLSAIAWQADRVEERLTGGDEN